MDKNTKDIIESLTFIKDNMATKDDLNDLEGRLGDRISKIDDRLTAVESKIEGTNRRLDIEAMSRTAPAYLTALPLLKGTSASTRKLSPDPSPSSSALTPIA